MMGGGAAGMEQEHRGRSNTPSPFVMSPPPRLPSQWTVCLILPSRLHRAVLRSLSLTLAAFPETSERFKNLSRLIKNLNAMSASISSVKHVQNQRFCEGSSQRRRGGGWGRASAEDPLKMATPARHANRREDSQPVSLGTRQTAGA